ncbi:MAG: tetratricopeptide repeat protein [Bdellovibrionota bacterium]
MDFETMDELFTTAEDHFKDNEYAAAEPILNQLVLKSIKKPEVFHMLGTIYYDQGKFNKAIRSFKRALEINPGFTDSSVGLSIILNDLGRYEEGQKVFDEARAMLSLRSTNNDHFMNEKFSQKHIELGDLYFQHNRMNEALEEFEKALTLTPQNLDVQMKMIDIYIAQKNTSLAIKELRALVRENPALVPARLKLGKSFYDSHQIPEAIEQWENALRYEPGNTVARDYLRLAQTVQVTSLNEPMVEL